MSNYDKDVENIYRQCGLDYLLDEISYDNNTPVSYTHLTLPTNSRV